MNHFDIEFAREILDAPDRISNSSYLNDGRRYAKLTVDALRSRWADALRRWLEIQSFERAIALEYLTGELKARGLHIPADLVPGEMRRMQSLVDNDDPDELSDADPGADQDE